MTAYFVSDLHLVSEEEEKTRVFLRFLAALLREAQSQSADAPTHLFLVGDIFDLWIGSHSYFLNRFAQTVGLIRSLVRVGVAVHSFEGNHDLHLEKFWGADLGVMVHGDAAEFKLGQIKVRVEHGDLINPDDRGYLFLRAALRSKPMTFLALHLPSFLVSTIGNRASQASRVYTSESPKKALSQDQIRQMIRLHAQKMFNETPFDLIITGHVHIQDDFVFNANGQAVRSVNLGSWYDSPKAFVLGENTSRFMTLS